MPKSNRLRSTDLHCIHRLSSDCRDLGDSSSLWRAHFASELAKLVDADLALTGEFETFTHRRRDIGNATWGFDHGFDVGGWVLAQELLRKDPEYAITFRSYAEKRLSNDGAALTRSQLVSDEEWDQSTEWQMVYRTLGVDWPLYCFHSMSNTDDDAHGLILCRKSGRGDFNLREAAIVRETVRQVTAMLGQALSLFRDPCPTRLGPRARQVLKCLLEGDSDKQIATRLGISRFTVNQHMKRIFVHFGVNTRSELMARWVRRAWGQKFSWIE